MDLRQLQNAELRPESFPGFRSPEQTVQGGRGAYESRVMNVLGDGLEGTKSVAESVRSGSASEGKRFSAAKEAVDPREKAMRDARQKLSSIKTAATAILNLGQEHRTVTYRDWLPLVNVAWAPIDRHRLANQEADLIDQFHRDVGELEFLVRSQGLPIDLVDLLRVSRKIAKPEGVSKWMATLTTPLGIGYLARGIHREWQSRKLTSIQAICSKLEGGLSVGAPALSLAA
jgi:hypothetical protein